ncbi:MAG: hypothetical protein LUE11_12925 [Clostridia bacterium]|nr:hypothetical protein [Clostridia bacterium]
MAADGSVVIEILGDAKDFASTLGSLATKAGAAFVGVSAAGIAALTKMSISAYADYEQLVGGVETLFKDSASTVEAYAANAFQTAGLSANAYMETVTSFSASLLQGLGGDTAQAAEVANTAITDMADNANKMGTSMQSIQDAYQGFAKQNYTMLDNLKLGYGGTQSEMIRLINDSGILNEKISDLDNVTFDQMIEAIHVIQTEMGISGLTAEQAAEAVASGAMTEEEAFEAMGTTAKEAATTIEGSWNSLKAAWENLMVGFADGSQDLGSLLQIVVDSVMTFGDNLIPRIQQVLENIGQAFKYLVPVIMTELPGIVSAILPGFISAIQSLATSIVSTLMTYGPEMFQGGLELLNNLADGIRQNLPQMLFAVAEALPTIAQGLVSGLDQITEVGVNIISALTESISSSLPGLIPAAMEALVTFSGSLRENVGQIVDAGLELITVLAQSLIDNLPVFIETIPTIITNLAGIINDNAPKLLETGIELIGQLVLGLIQAIPTLIANIPNIIQAIVAVFTAYNWLNLGKQIITGLKNGISNMAGQVKTAATNVQNSVVNAVKNLPSKLLNVGKNAVSQMGSGIRGAVGVVRSAITTIVNAIINLLRAVPSKVVSIGKNIVQGIANGIRNAASAVVSALGNVVNNAISSVKKKLGIASPSKLFKREIGRWIPPGIGEGVEESMPELEKQVNAELDNLAANVQARVNYDVAKRSDSKTTGTTNYVNHSANQGDTNIHNENNLTFNSPKALSRREIRRETRNILRRLQKA